MEQNKKPQPSVSFRSERRGRFRLSILELEIASLPEAFENYRILHLTDFHFGPSTPHGHIKAGLKAANKLNPDLIFLTGDYLQTSPTGLYHVIARNVSPRVSKLSKHRRKGRRYAERLSEIVSILQARDGIIATLGNHDYSEGAGTIKRKLPQHINWLVNESTVVRKDGAELFVAGLDDLRRGYPDLKSTLRLPTTLSADAPRILLSHSPDVTMFEDKHLLEEVDLILSGHTHGGQICLPGGRPIVTRTKQKDHYSGLSWYKDESGNPVTPVYVNAGLGYGLVSVRTFCPPEIGLIVLKRVISEKTTDNTD